MNIEEIRKAMLLGEDLEYHITGGETDPHKVLPVPGWYPCTIYEVCPNGNVEIGLYVPKFPLGLEVTVLNKNISIAFRQKQAQEVQA